MPLPMVSQSIANKIIDCKLELSTWERLDEFRKEQPYLAEYIAAMVVFCPSQVQFIVGTSMFIYDGLKEQVEVNELNEFKRMYEAK